MPAVVTTMKSATGVPVQWKARIRHRPLLPPPLHVCRNEEPCSRSMNSTSTSERCTAANRWLSEKRTFSTFPRDSTVMG